MVGVGVGGNDSKITFISLCIAVVAVIIDTSIVKVYRFVTTPLSLDSDVSVFIVFAVTQYILLRSVRINTETSKRLIRNSLHKIVSVIQCILIGLLISVILQMIIISAYNTAIVAAAITISYVLAMIIMGLLSLQFFSWFRSTKNSVVLAYNFAAVAFMINAGFTLVYVLTALIDVSVLVRPHTGHITGFTVYSDLLTVGYVSSSIMSFLISWVATILLLRHHSKKIGELKYWILVTIPLVYFIGQFQPSFLDLFSTYRVSNPILFNVLYTIIFNLSKPVGGILFGVAFWVVARSIHHKTVRSYLTISGYGILLLIASNQAAVLINSPYPPFGMVAVSFVGLSSYLMFIGIYSSAISVAQDMKLRESIRKSVEHQLIDEIGTAQMEQDIIKNVSNLTNKLAIEISTQTGVEPSLDEQDIREYLDKVIKETKSIK
jgi:hypothetical protein